MQQLAHITRKNVSLGQRLLALCLLCLVASPALALDSSHLMQSLRLVAMITEDIAIGMGVALFFGGMLKLKRYGEMRTFMSQQMTLGKPMMMLFAGICLLCLPVFTATLLASVWGYASPLAYPQMSSYDGEQVIRPVIYLVRLVGVFGIVRGIILMSRAGGESSQPGTMGKVLMHIVGGLLCVHVINVYHVLHYALNFSS